MTTKETVASIHGAENVSNQRISDAYQRIDIDGKGFISSVMFIQLLKDLRVEVSDELVRKYTSLIAKDDQITLETSQDWIPTIAMGSIVKSPAKSPGFGSGWGSGWQLNGKTANHRDSGERNSATIASGATDQSEAKNKMVNAILDALKEVEPDAVGKIEEQGGRVSLYNYLNSNNYLNTVNSSPVISSPSMHRKKSQTQESFLKSISSRVSDDDPGEASCFVGHLALMHQQHGIRSPKTISGAVMMVDISGFSLVTSTLHEQGKSPYVLTGVVNSYLQPIIDIICEFGGDVINFAGDAIVVMWYSKDAQIDCTLALGAAMQLQKRCRFFSVLDSGLAFSIHVGIDYGKINSMILESRSIQPSPRNYHLVSGAPIHEAAEACCCAKSEQICVTNEVIVRIHPLAKVTQHLSEKNKAFMIVDQFLEDVFESEIQKPGKMQHCSVDEGSAELFVPTPVFTKIEGGIDRFFLSELRKLSVMFIQYKGSNVRDVRGWFNEVTSVAFRNNIDIIQILENEKGTHVIAACNLYTMSQASGDSCICFAKELRAHDASTIIGVASGEVLCGVVGATQSCRWDISGAPVVRACRLMEHAKNVGVTEVFDVSILDSASDLSLLQEMEPVKVKGSAVPVKIYSLLPQADMVSSMLHLTTDLHFTHRLCGNVHRDLISTIKAIVTDRGEGVPAVILIKGPFGSGKFSVVLNSLHGSRFVPVVHLCDESRREKSLALLETIAGWLVCSDKRVIHQTAEQLLVELAMQHHTNAFFLAIDLIRLVTQEHLNIAVIVRRGHLLDQSSISFLCVASVMFANSSAWISFMCFYPVYENENPEESFVVGANSKQFTIEYVTETECRALVEHLLKSTSSRELSSFVFQKTEGHVECIVELVSFLADRGLMKVQRDGSMTVGPKRMKHVLDKNWSEIAPILQAKSLAILDRVPPRLLVMCKIVCSITQQKGISAFFHSVNAVARVLMNEPLCEDDVAYLQKLMLLRLTTHKCTAHSGGTKLDAAVYYLTPMRDIVQDLQVPQQNRLINDICGRVYIESHPMNHPLQFLVRARHFFFAQQMDNFHENLQNGWALLRGKTWNDFPVIQKKYLEVFSFLTQAEIGKVLQTDANEVARVAREAENIREVREGKMFGVEGDSGSSTSSAGGRRSSGVSDAIVLLSLKKFVPSLAFGPLAEYYAKVVETLVQLYDYVQHLVAAEISSPGSDVNSRQVKESKDEHLPIFFVSRLTKAVSVYLTAYQLLLNSTAICKKQGDTVEGLGAIARIMELLCAGDNPGKLKAKTTFSIIVRDFAEHVNNDLPRLLTDIHQYIGQSAEKTMTTQLIPAEAFAEFPSLIRSLGVWRADEVGRVLYILYESLPEILILTNTESRKISFCNALYELCKASRGMRKALPSVCADFRCFLQFWLVEECSGGYRKEHTSPTAEKNKVDVCEETLCYDV